MLINILNYNCTISDVDYLYLFLIIIEISYNNSAQENIDQVIQNMNNVEIDPVENDDMHHHHHGSRYSDYTEKLQSLYPKCK